MMQIHNPHKNTTILRLLIFHIYNLLYVYQYYNPQNTYTTTLPHSNDHGYNSIQTGLLCLDVERLLSSNLLCIVLFCFQPLPPAQVIETVFFLFQIIAKLKKGNKFDENTQVSRKNKRTFHM